MGMPRLRHLLAILFVTSAPIVVGCAAKAPAGAPAQPEASQAGSYGQQAGYAQPAATQAPGAYGSAPWAGIAEPPASDLPGLQAQLDRAEQALGFAFGSPAQLGSTSGADAVSPAQKSASSPTATAAAPAAPIAPAHPCPIACAALASMKRSADHICTMAGDGDAACGGARDRVKRAEQRVAESCPACSGR